MLINEKILDDQANGLRNIRKPVQAIAVTAGKGGVGKTNVAVNLAISLSSQNKNVVLLDADLGLANIDIMLGLHPKLNLSHLMNQQCELEDVLLDGPSGLKIIPASSGVEVMTNLNRVEHAGLINAFSTLTNSLDFLIIDTAAGISDTVMSFTCASQEVIVVVCNEPTSITDAYALIKVMSKEHGVKRFRILANMVRNYQEGYELYTKLFRVSERFLDVNLDFLGAIPFDEHVRKAIQRQKAVLDVYPSSRAATEIKNLTKKIVKWPVNTDISGGTTFFLERLVESV